MFRFKVLYSRFKDRKESFVIVQESFINLGVVFTGKGVGQTADGLLNQDRDQLTEGLKNLGNTYLNIAEIMNGEVSTLLNNPSINFQSGCLVLLAGTLFLFGVGYLLLSRKTWGEKNRRVMGK